MIDFNSKLGRKAKKHLKQEYFIWLTTVDSKNTPQPRPVWFIFEKNSILIFSQPQAFKLKHIARNNKVSLHFNTLDKKGEEDVIIFTGEAKIETDTPPANKISAYLRKYRAGIKSFGGTPDLFAKEYPTAVRISLDSLRGF
ncbi:MAG: TIGR03667 family PPOX class F420-dependent oxidoreductase [Anaerolineales bacterium]